MVIVGEGWGGPGVAATDFPSVIPVREAERSVTGRSPAGPWIMSRRNPLDGITIIGTVGP
ncbi:hypothetical protein GCM10010472_59030 [Pseudonocardia halophobica]|uniref:Uncharacterized protein n=1 Tax=Pseudonocardia halophobica TaxID=29401 RepID=A0A9W6NZV5_9PSEU|nr:hypothetical protein [Pseudonocardia halophobica]GLL15259.1 hypothetical protein GCM10017577_64090 [Pseudonocardia halophobica]